jgi:hypothetical protein
MNPPTIPGYCFTNLDEYKRLKWPTQFVAVPREGDLVESNDSGLSSRSLKVVRITHAVNSQGPYVRVELHC